MPVTLQCAPVFSIPSNRLSCGRSCAASVVRMGNCCCRRDANSHTGHQQSLNSWSRSGSPRSTMKIRSTTTNADFVAFWEYRTSTKGELDIRKGDEFVQLEPTGQCEATDGSWVFVMRVTGDDPAIGYVRRAFLVPPAELETFKWNFGPIDRNQTEAILRNARKGTFLVRSKTPSKPGRKSPEALKGYVLSVKFVRATRHYKIIRSIDEQGCPKFTIAGDSKRYSHLRDMIEDLQSGVAADILCCELKAPAPKPRPPVSEPLPLVVQETWTELNRRRIRLGALLGKAEGMNSLNLGFIGRSAMVSKVVAVRKMQETPGGLERFLSEAVALKTLSMRSSRFVQILGVMTVSRPYLLVMEYFSDGTLRKYLRTKEQEKKPLPEATLVNISLQIADALRVMEQESIAHRSLSADRVFVIEEKAVKTKKKRSDAAPVTVKVGGLSWSTALKSSWDPVRASSGAQTLALKWMAPEVVAGQDSTVVSDVWSYGITLHEIFTHGREPYAGLTDDSMRRVYLQAERTIDRDPAVPKKMYELIRKCCRYDPTARWSFSQIYMFLDRYYVLE